MTDKNQIQFFWNVKLMQTLLDGNVTRQRRECEGQSTVSDERERILVDMLLILKNHTRSLMPRRHNTMYSITQRQAVTDKDRPRGKWLTSDLSVLQSKQTAHTFVDDKTS